MQQRFIQIMLSIALLTSNPTLSAFASPVSLWFFFDRAPESVQLVGCRSVQLRQCKQPTLLIQHGICSAAGCLNSSPRSPSAAQFQCAETACLYQRTAI